MTEINTNNTNNQENKNVQSTNTRGEQLMNSVKICSKKVFTKKNLKKAVVAAAIVAAICGGASYYNHQQRVAAHEQMISAQNRIIEAQAANNNITLLDQSKIKSIAANAVGQDESALSFNEVALLDITNIKNDRNHKEPKDREQKPAMKGEQHGPSDRMSRQGGPQGSDQPNPMNHHQPSAMMADGNGQMMAPQGQPPVQQDQQGTEQQPTSPTTQNQASTVDQLTMKSIYLVSMVENKVHYKVAIDAVYGQVLNIDVFEGGLHGGPHF